MTHGGPLSPTIFNVVLDVVLWNWVALVVVTEGGVEPATEGLGKDIQHKSSYFYADNKLLASTLVNRIQWVFDSLTGLGCTPTWVRR